MSDDLLFLPPARPLPDPWMVERAERIGSELMRFLRHVRGASQPVRCKLQRDMRERLEVERRSLLGGRAVLPESLRHYAITFTEVQWQLDAWIAATEREGDDPVCRRDFIDAAARMLGETDALALPQAPAVQGPPRSDWWLSLTRRLRADHPLRAGFQLEPRPGLPDLVA